jgi:hypothetical protein
VPTTVTFIPAGADAPAPRTVPAIVALPPPEGDGLVGEPDPPHAVAAAIPRHTAVSKSDLRIDMGARLPELTDACAEQAECLWMAWRKFFTANELTKRS